MVKIKEAIIVEGAYDKIKLLSYVDAVVYVTGGFSVMSDKERLAAIKTLAETVGIVILTDSDSAGFRIRSFLNERIKSGTVKNAYIPDMEGKEKRKRLPGKEGLLGVEGMNKEIIINALNAAGCVIDGAESKCGAAKAAKITTADLYMLGLSGRKDSAARREKLLREYKLPSKLSSKLMCDILSRITTLDEIAEKLKCDGV